MKHQEAIDSLQKFHDTVNGKQGVSCLRAIIQHLKEEDYDSAKRVADLEFDKLWQYEVFGLPQHIDTYFGLNKYKSNVAFTNKWGRSFGFTGGREGYTPIVSIVKSNYHRAEKGEMMLNISPYDPGEAGIDISLETLKQIVAWAEKQELPAGLKLK